MASRPGHREIWFAATAGALLIIAGLHLLPDAWSGARSARIWPGLVPAAAPLRSPPRACPPAPAAAASNTSKNASGAGTAAALAIHRVLEGSAIALAGTAAVAAALAVHAFAEGLATGALPGAQPRRIAGWLAAICVGPVIGAAATGAFAVPAAAGPVLLGLAAGVLTAPAVHAAG